MKALYLFHVPIIDAERLKTKSPERFTILGARIYASEVFRALLRYSSYDVMFAPESKEQASFRESDLYARNRDRIRFIAEHELPLLGNYDTAVISQRDPDIYIGARIRRLSRCSSVPVTGVIHALDSPSHLQMTAMILGSSLQPYDALICSSRAGRDALLNYLQVVKERIAMTGARGYEARFATPVIPLGLDTEDFSGEPQTDVRGSLGIDAGVVILYFGRLSETTKADLVPLMITFSQVLSSGHDAWLLLAGNDTHYGLADRLRATAVGLGCGSRVRVLLNPSGVEKRDLYRSADIFVAPSDNLQETFGIALTEAMAARLPVVASDWSGHRDIVVENQTGHLIPTIMPLYAPGPGETADMLAATTTLNLCSLQAALQSLVSSKEKRMQFGLAGQQRARSLYDWKAVIGAYEELWDDLSRRAKPPVSNLAPELDLEQYDYRKIFRHYASSWLGSDTAVSLTNLGRACLETPDRLATYLGASPLFLPADIQVILEDLAKVEAATVSEVVSRNARKDDPAGRSTMRSICRLLKYGLLRTGDSRIDASETAQYASLSQIEAD